MVTIKEIDNKEKNKKYFLTDFFEKKDFFAINNKELNIKIKNEIKNNFEFFDKVIKNQLNFWKLNFSDLKIDVIKDLINFEDIKRWLEKTKSNINFINEIELKQIENEDLLKEKKYLWNLEEEFKKWLSVWYTIWLCDRISFSNNMFNLKRCDEGEYISIWQYFIIDKNIEATEYEDLSDLYFEEIYGDMWKDKGYYDFVVDKIIFFYYSFKNNNILIEYIDYNWESKKNIIVNEETDYLEYSWSLERKNVTIKQKIITKNDINSKFNLNNFIEIKENEVVIKDETIIQKNKFVDYNYYCRFKNTIKKINNIVEKILNEKDKFVNEKLKFNFEDILDIETAFWRDIKNLKKELNKYLNRINLDNETIEIETLIENDDYWYMYSSNKLLWKIKNDIVKKDLYDEVIKQILIQYIFYYVYSKFEKLIEIFDTTKLSSDILENFERLKIKLIIKQWKMKNEIQISIF